MEDRFEITRDELNHIYWALKAYRDEFFTIYKDRKEANETWQTVNQLRKEFAELRKNERNEDK